MFWQHSLSGRKSYESQREWGHLSGVEPWPMACQSEECFSVFVQYKFLPASLFWLGPVFNSFISKLWQEAFLSCFLGWHEVYSIRFQIFCCNCSCMRQRPLVFLHLCFGHFQIFFVCLSSPPFTKRTDIRIQRSLVRCWWIWIMLLEEKTPLAGSWLIVDSTSICSLIHLPAVILQNNIEFDFWA